MTKEEFIQDYRASQKHGNGWGVVWVVLLAGFIAASGIFSFRAARAGA